MARLISKPAGLLVRSATPLSGPRAIGAASNTSVGGFQQTVASAFGMWRWQFTFPVAKDEDFRRYRGWVTALHAGANATRFRFFDPDMMSAGNAGLIATAQQLRFGMPWSNGEPWSSGKNWEMSIPPVAVADASGRDESMIRLSNQRWGWKLIEGDYLGFFPFHLGLYIVTEALDDGLYRIWPPLRKEIGINDRATLYPVLAMRLESEDAATASRGVAYAEEQTVTMVEVADYDARDYFAD